MEHPTNLSEFRSILSRAGARLVAVDFYADWCGPCRQIAPLFESLCSQYSGSVVFVKVDVDHARDIAQICGITAMPTFQFYKNGQKVEEFRGADPNRLRSYIESNAGPVAFVGQGMRLGSAGSQQEGPKIVWDKPVTKTENKEAISAAAAAAAKRAAKANLVSTTTNNTSNAFTPITTTSTAGAPSNPGNAADAAVPTSTTTAIETTAASSEPTKQTPQASPAAQVNQEFFNVLQEMGFPENRCIKALVTTQNQSVEVASEWIFEHMDDPDIDDPLSVVDAVVVDAQANKPVLSEDEKRQKAQQMIDDARKKREEDEKKREVEREKARIAGGKEVTAAKAKYEDAQRKRDIEARKKEKLDAIKEKQRLRALLEQDKKERAEKFGMNISNAAGGTSEHAPPTSATTATETANETARAATTVTLTEGTVQIRLPDGTRLTSSFKVTDTMQTIAQFIDENRPDLKGRFVISTQYPKQVFTADKLDSVSLMDVKLLPRGSVIVSMK